VHVRGTGEEARTGTSAGECSAFAARQYWPDRAAARRTAWPTRRHWWRLPSHAVADGQHLAAEPRSVAGEGNGRHGDTRILHSPMPARGAAWRRWRRCSIRERSDTSIAVESAHWRCLGWCGSGSIAAWLAARVGHTGRWSPTSIPVFFSRSRPPTRRPTITINRCESAFDRARPPRAQPVPRPVPVLPALRAALARRWLVTKDSESMAPDPASQRGALRRRAVRLLRALVRSPFGRRLFDCHGGRPAEVGVMVRAVHREPNCSAPTVPSCARRSSPARK
jgi:hypothetical protein